MANIYKQKTFKPEFKNPCLMTSWNANFGKSFLLHIIKWNYWPHFIFIASEVPAIGNDKSINQDKFFYTNSQFAIQAFVDMVVSSKIYHKN